MTLDTEVRKLRTDALPEHARYADTGCELHPTCLTCPLPVCKEELTQGAQAVRAYMQGLQIALLRSEGRTVEWIAQVLGITVRGVYKSVARQRELGALTDTLRRSKIDIAATPKAENGRGHNGR